MPIDPKSQRESDEDRLRSGHDCDAAAPADPWEDIIQESRKRAFNSSAATSGSGPSPAVALDGRQIRGRDWTKIVYRW